MTLRKARHYAIPFRPLLTSYFVSYKTMEPPTETMLASSVASTLFDRFSFDDVYYSLPIVGSLGHCCSWTRSVHDSEGCERVSNTGARLAVDKNIGTPTA